MIKLNNVNKYYQSGNDKIHVIKNLSYTFPNTGLIFILGPSGSGKSTLLNLLGGLGKPDSGEIWIENRELNTFSKTEQTNYLNSYLGFVFQEYNILKDLTLKQNISLSLEIQGATRKEIKNKVSEIINLVELNGLEKRKVNQLSGGQKQRIAIARALVKDPSLIIADEPTGNLDSETSKKIFELLKNLSKNRLIIVVTHDEESANLYGDDILHIDTPSIYNPEEEKFHEELSLSSTYFDRKLYLEKAKTPIKTISKLAFKNMWHKKFQYLLIFLICTICLSFLSFAIELNGDKLYQNIYTTVNNNNSYAEIYQYHPTKSSSKSNDFYAKYTKGELMNNAYSTIKYYTNDIIIHKYQKVEIDYSKYNIEKANFLYSGTIDSIIYFDKTNSYKLLAGTLPKENEAEILITDFLLDALKHFGIVSTNSTIYSILNTYLDLGYQNSFKIVGVLETNYHKWIHLSRLNSNHKIDPYDEEMQGFKYDYLMMNSIVVGEKYYNYILNDSFHNTIIQANNYILSDNSLVNYIDQDIYLGSAPKNDNEIVIPRSLVLQVFNMSLTHAYVSDWYIRNVLIGQTINISTSLTEVETETGSYEVSANATYKLVGCTSSLDFLVTENSLNSYKEAIKESKATRETERIIIELSNDPNVVLSQFKKLYNTDYHFVIDVFNYQSQIESYNVDPIIEFASTGGLIIFTILTIGIMWTIISIEIVDSRKEIGIMRSIGIDGKKVSLIFIIQTLFACILAYFASLPIANQIINLYGNGLTDALGEINLSMYTMTYRTPLYLIIFVIGIAFISTIIPLFKIMSKKIINIINERDN